MRVHDGEEQEMVLLEEGAVLSAAPSPSVSPNHPDKGLNLNGAACMRKAGEREMSLALIV